MDSYVCGEIPTSERKMQWYVEVYTIDLALCQVLNNIQRSVIPFQAYGIILRYSENYNSLQNILSAYRW